MRKMLLILILLSFMMTPYLDSFHASADESAVPNELLVKYSGDYRTFTVEETLEEIESVEVVAPQVNLLTFSEDVDMEDIKRQLEEDPSVESVEPNYVLHLLGEVNDPGYNNQWWIPHVQAESMWAYAVSQQKKVVVAVIDSGIDPNHEDLIRRIEPGGYNFYSNNTTMSDVNGHGTQVSGVIAAESGNGVGISGIAGPYDVSILPLKILHDGTTSNTSNLIKAIDYAIEKKVDVINISLGGAGRSINTDDAIQRAIRAGIVVVAAAGNDAKKGNPFIYPASYDNVIAVGAVDENNERSPFSTYNRYVDLVAPGEQIYTTSPYHSYNYAKGTSFSSPIVAGTVAMVIALEPSLSISEIEDLLKKTSKDLGGPGRDDYYGAGVLDIERLVAELNLEKYFVGDFPEMAVGVSKVFEVTFNQELDPSKEYSRDVIVSRNSDGSGGFASFAARVNPENSKQLLIEPTTKWDRGEYYLTITTAVQNKANKPLKENVRMKFVVE